MNKQLINALKEYSENIRVDDSALSHSIEEVIPKIEQYEAQTKVDFVSAWNGDKEAAARLTRKKVALNCPFCGKPLSEMDKFFSSSENNYRYGIIHLCDVESTRVIVSIYSEDAEKVLNTWNIRAREAGGCEFE